jgi:D-glycero-D-manno-heptose 1,7-bisphosphate phosphatase
MRPAVFLERDGILTSTSDGNGSGAASNAPLPRGINAEAVPVMRELKSAGFLLILTANEPGLSSGEVSRWELDHLHGQLRKTFDLDDILICPHDPSDRCHCRKPRPGLFTEAAFKWHIDLPHSFVISNKWPDAEAARAVGCTSLLIESPWIGTGHRDIVLPSLSGVLNKLGYSRAAGPVAPVLA